MTEIIQNHQHHLAPSTSNKQAYFNKPHIKASTSSKKFVAEHVWDKQCHDCACTCACILNNDNTVIASEEAWSCKDGAPVWACICVCQKIHWGRCAHAYNNKSEHLTVSQSFSKFYLLNMFKLLGLFFPLSSFLSSFIFVFLSRGMWWSQILAQSAKNT